MWRHFYFSLKCLKIGAFQLFRACWKWSIETATIRKTHPTLPHSQAFLGHFTVRNKISFEGSGGCVYLSWVFPSISTRISRPSASWPMAVRALWTLTKSSKLNVSKLKIVSDTIIWIKKNLECHHFQIEEHFEHYFFHFEQARLLQRQVDR